MIKSSTFRSGTLTFILSQLNHLDSLQQNTFFMICLYSEKKQ